MTKIFSFGLLIFYLCATTKIAAQNYNNDGAYKTSFGLRGGGERGASVKHFIKDNIAVEALLTGTSSYGGTRLTALLEVQKPLSFLKNISWFYGAGAHIGFYTDKIYIYNDKPELTKNKYSTVAIDGIVGLEYRVATLPFTIGLDLKPFMNVIGTNTLTIDKGVTVRYIFK